MLRATHLTGLLEDDTQISPGVYFSADTKGGNTRITLHPTEGGLLNADLKITGNPVWLTLNIGLGTGRFETGDTVGIVADLGNGDDTFNVQPFIRSNDKVEQFDTVLAQTLAFGGTHGVTTLLHTIAAQDALSHGEAFHTLIIPLPKRDLSMKINDLRFLHIKAATSAHLQGTTLGGLAI